MLNGLLPYFSFRSQFLSKFRVHLNFSQLWQFVRIQALIWRCSLMYCCCSFTIALKLTLTYARTRTRTNTHRLWFKASNFQIFILHWKHVSSPHLFASTPFKQTRKTVHWCIRRTVKTFIGLKHNITWRNQRNERNSWIWYFVI